MSSFSFYNLLLVGSSSLPPHFTLIPTSLRIPRDPHDFKGFPWKFVPDANEYSAVNFPASTNYPQLPTLLCKCLMPAFLFTRHCLGQSPKTPLAWCPFTCHPDLRVGPAVIRPEVNSLHVHHDKLPRWAPGPILGSD